MEGRDVEILGDQLLDEVDTLQAKLREERRYRRSYRAGKRVLKGLTPTDGQPNGRIHCMPMSRKTTEQRATRGST